nr:hypothetical protein [Tanacetum cinerariifolium]
MVYFSVVPRDGIFEIYLSDSYTNVSSMYALSSKRAKSNLDSALLWHCRLGHISKKRIEKLQRDGLLNSTDLMAFEKCVPCMSGNMASKPYIHQVERAKDLLGLIHTDHKHEMFETFKVFQKEVENQLVMTIKSLRSDRRGEYISQEFLDHLKDHQIIAHYTLSYTPQHNGVLERRNKTLLDMVQSMMSQTTLPKSFWDYAFETAARILNMIPTKKFEKTPYKDTQRKQWVILSTIHAEFLENSFITQEASGSLEELKIIQKEDTHPSIDASLNHKEDDLEIDEPQSDIIPICVVDLPPNGKTVGSKWLFKKKTDMDGAVHTYNARLVANGYTQTSRIDYEETFSPVADIRAIRILIAMAAFSNYEIWQMDVKTAFLNGYLSKEVYMEQPEGFVNPKYPNQVCKLKRSIYGLKCFAMKDLGEAAYILGIKIYRDRSRQLTGLCQSAYIEKILKRYHMENSKLGSDIKRELKVSCYTDAGYLTDTDDLKSQTGYVFVLNGGSVDCKSAKQSIFATSSTEVEYIVAYDASKEAVWVRKFIYRLGVVPTIEEPISMYCDNTGAITIANKSRITKGARHFCTKVHYLREVIEYGDVKLEKVHTDDNLADPFTKALSFPKHSEHTKNIGMLPASSLM